MKSIKDYIRHPKYILISIMTHTAALWPDKLYLQAIYYLREGKKLNLKSPGTFTEKINWLKLYDKNPLYTKLADKIAVKKYVAERIGSEYIVPTIAEFNTVDDIDWAGLPNQFVLKCTHDSGGNVICMDKNSLDIEKSKAKLKKRIKKNFYLPTREWAYKNVPRRVIAENYLRIPGKTDLTDYKIFCFNGAPRYIQVIMDRNKCETIDFFDTNWMHQPFIGFNPKYKNAKELPDKPKNLDTMISIAKILCENIPFVRVDLYNICGRIYFGELTFYPAAGLGSFNPLEWDLKLGQCLNLHS